MKKATNKQDLEQSVIVLSSAREMFSEQADKSPGLTHVLIDYPRTGKAPKLPECYKYINDDAFCSTAGGWKCVDGKKVRDDRMIMHWLCKPHNHSWSLTAAQSRLKTLSEGLSDITNYADWMLRLHHVFKPKKYVIATLDDAMKVATTGIGERCCRLAQPDEAFFSIIDDVFLRSAQACDVLLMQVSPKGRKTDHWCPPTGYVGALTIELDYEVPRSTLQAWDEKDHSSGTLEERQKDPKTGEIYYPEPWFLKRFKNYKPRTKR